jgi:hypothetical protein
MRSKIDDIVGKALIFIMLAFAIGTVWITIEAITEPTPARLINCSQERF